MKLIALCFTIACVLIGSGCVTHHTLPRDSRIVGGGLDIEWTAPSDGTAVLMEKNTHKVVATRSLADGEKFEFNTTKNEDDANALKSAFGETTPSKSNFILYFSPRYSETHHRH